MNKIKIILILSLIFQAGCAKLIQYQPNSLSVQQALTQLEKEINNNPMGRGVVVDFANERFIRLKGNVGAGESIKIVPFRTTSQITLHTKKGRNIVTIYNTSEIIHHRFLFNKRHNATALIDALSTLKNNKLNRTNKQVFQIAYGGKVGKSGERKAAESISQENKQLKQQIQQLRLQKNALEDKGLSEKPLGIGLFNAPIESKKQIWREKGIIYEEDDFDSVSWYRDIKSQLNHGTRLTAHIGKKKRGKPWLVLKMKYRDNDWLFIHSFTVLADGKKYKFENKVFLQDHNDGIVQEWLTERAGQKHLSVLKAVSKSKDAVIRMYGKLYFKDHKITENEKQGILAVLKAYDELKV